ncbi:hypothetical protein [Halobacteriovorax sp. JY17]|uniref:hypothetical protein n=1 Tax=Halobacteriovorax sp. JY17 TaxID=2014617 RepID=UPI000C533B49|nr:hypothetical protein [Halobacteriovorax sp. JY17]PIK14720.1 MAG: hypothetical protein CES88_10300 [Halobacteriovorax sp. JY17]
MKEINTIIRELEKRVIIDGNRITRIAFDLKHINFGWDKNRRDYKTKQRSFLTDIDVLYFIIHLNNYEIDKEGLNRILLPSGVLRYIFKVWDEEVSYRMVIDIRKVSNELATIVTIYRK